MGADLITLASMLRIPVVMHNVEEERIFRPHAWGSFGTRDTEAADMLHARLTDRCTVNFQSIIYNRGECDRSPHIH